MNKMALLKSNNISPIESHNSMTLTDLDEAVKNATVSVSKVEMYWVLMLLELAF